MTVGRFAGAEIGKMLGKGPRFDNIGAQGGKMQVELQLHKLKLTTWLIPLRSVQMHK